MTLGASNIVPLERYRALGQLALLGEDGKHESGGRRPHVVLRHPRDGLAQPVGNPLTIKQSKTAQIRMSIRFMPCPRLPRNKGVFPRGN